MRTARELLVEKMNGKRNPDKAFWPACSHWFYLTNHRAAIKCWTPVPIDEEIKQALIQRKGVLRDLGDGYRFEQARWMKQRAFVNYSG